ncbi:MULTISPECIES: carbonic anhydrase [unclassified Pseudactinotalea]|uniref:carbonic anhydrase n=1 Tax=unclassified Pseudactinotalea TaxID=2649176 RepID=UPI00128B2CEF|nr:MULTISPECIES: carbonic anhydrase [unclassified Pseudactinotalea]MPV48731.1 carbonic anhydrase [Pseudactinotalea sp. HY160]QGH68719.1 carbonic anhydrase [Pseudactinotalea sp. HY158]
MSDSTTTTSPQTPAQAWAALVEGNRRFVAGEMRHPGQNMARRNEVSKAQHPFAVLLGCSDSRVASELIFDQGLGDLFVVRNAGHVLDTTVIGSVEFGVDLLDTPLVVVLGHENCGAVGAAREALLSGNTPNGMVRAIVDRVTPSIVTRAPSHAVGGTEAPSPADGFELVLPDPAEMVREHVRETVHMLGAYSQILARAVESGTCAIVGAKYSLSEGRVELVEALGDIG